MDQPDWDSKAQLEAEIEKLEFINGFLYDALGPANDDIYQMALEAWEVENG